MLALEEYRTWFEERLLETLRLKEPKGLYEPVHYISKMGGKRLRPVLTLMTAGAFGAIPDKVFPAALAVEWFHNFTLIHDDIMDRAPLRRGQKTVHEKWNVNTGILSGDVLLVMAHRCLEAYPPELFKKLSALLLKTAQEVCEGQQYDMDFETQSEVSAQEYATMIGYKTAVLIGAAMQIGATVALAPEAEAEKCYQVGFNLGMGFQLMDDYLDVFGDSEKFGKQAGGDIAAHKKTILYVKALEMASPEEASLLRQIYTEPLETTREKIEVVKQLFTGIGIDRYVLAEVEAYTKHAYTILKSLEIREEAKDIFRLVGDLLMNRRV